MSRHCSSLCLVIILAVLLLSSGGCTVVGFGVGSLIDNANSGVEHVPAARIGEVPGGRQVVCVLKDQSRVHGVSEGAGWSGEVDPAVLGTRAQKGAVLSGVPLRFGDRLLLQRSGRPLDTVVFVAAD